MYHPAYKKDVIITQEYNPANDHYGIDTVSKRYATAGHPICSVATGTVVEISEVYGKYGWYYTSGKYVAIDHGSGIVTAYKHLNSIVVKINDKVYKGTLIGTEGKTGNSTGVHLHFDVFEGNNRVNPKPYILGEKKFKIGGDEMKIPVISLYETTDAIPVTDSPNGNLIGTAPANVLFTTSEIQCLADGTVWGHHKTGWCKIGTSDGKLVSVKPVHDEYKYKFDIVMDRIKALIKEYTT